MWFLFCGIFLLIAELINTAIEYIVDRIGKEYNPISGYAKDMGSAIVLLSLVNLLVSWLVFKFY
jgi:diacylglycerol kinase (ATP)